LGLTGRLRLGRHLFRVDDPGADVGLRQSASHVVKRSLRIALSRHRMTECAFLIDEDLLALFFGALTSRGGRDAKAQYQRDQRDQRANTCPDHEASLSPSSLR